MCDYFILTKEITSDTGCDKTNQVIALTNKKVYILPKNNITYYIDHGLFEKNLIEWCKQLCVKDKNFLDIGAHSGTYSISLSDQCKTVYAFEPQKMSFYSLCGSVALSNIKNIECINIGLGSENQVGKQILNICSLDGGGSSIVNTSNILQTEEINIRTLDSFNIDNIGFIKIDIEDNELNALLFSQNTLKKSNYPKILFEMNNINTDLTDFLKGLGYSVLKIGGFSNMFLAEQPSY